MRILMLTQVPPYPPDAGPKIKTHYLLRTLVLDHEVELITYVRNDAEREAAQALQKWCARVETVPLLRKRWKEPLYAARGWVRRRPFLVERDDRKAMRDAIERRLSAADFDVLHADQLSMAQYFPLAEAHGVKTLFDAHNAVWQLVRSVRADQPTPVHRVAAEVEWRLLRNFEHQAARRADAVLSVSHLDLQLLGPDLDRHRKAAVVPIGIEARDVKPVPFSESAQRLLSVSTLHYPPNASALRWFRDEVWPDLRARNPAAELDIVGHRPPADLVRWGELDDRVTVHGYVEDLEPLYRRAAVFLAPLLAGSGVRVKILEAMTRGLPVVTTSIGVEGLDVQHGIELLVADEAIEFASSVTHLLTTPDQRRRIGEAGRTKVLDTYDWRNCCRPALNLYQRLSELPDPATGSGTTVDIPMFSQHGDRIH